MSISRRDFLSGAVKASAAFGLASIVSQPAESRIRRRRADFVFQPGQLDSPLIAQEADSLIVPASLTKMMTGLVAYEQIIDHGLDPEEPLRLSPNARKQPPVKYGGRVIPHMSDALNLMMVRSYNDVAAGLAEAVAGTEWAFYNEHMMPRARMLGMERTKFYNASGLPVRGQGENLTTAQDLGRLMEFITLERPGFLEYMGHENYQDPRRGRVHNTNHLLEGATSDHAVPVDGVFAGKTGTINASGSNLALWAQRDGHSLIGIFTGFSNYRERNAYVSKKIEEAFSMLEVNLSPDEPGLRAVS